MEIVIHLAEVSGIKNPVDINGQEIHVGHVLSWDYGDSDYVALWMRQPVYVVENRENGEGMCARGINKCLYLHDFRFKHCEIIGHLVK